MPEGLDAAAQAAFVAEQAVLTNIHNVEVF